MDEVAGLIALVETLTAEVKRLTARVCELEVENITLKAENLELKEENRKLKTRLGMDSNNSSKPPSSNPPWVKPEPKKKPSGKKPGGQPGHKGTARNLVPPEAVDHRIPVFPANCKKCNSAIDEQMASHPGWTHQIIEIPPIQCVITNYEMQSCQCETCGEWTTASLPVGVPSVIAGPNLQALIAYITGRMRISRRYLQEFLGAVGVKLSLGTLQSILENTSNAIAKPAEEAHEAVKKSEAVNCDETSFGRSNDKRRWWLWVASSMTAVAFKLASGRGRGRDQLAELLPANYEGIIHRDRWKSYEVMQCAKHALCHAHLARNFQGLIDQGGKAKPIGEYLLEKNHQMFSLWHRFLDDELTREGLIKEMEPTRAGMKEKLQQVLDEEKPDDKARALATDLLRQWDSLWTFVDNEGVSPTNNEAESQLRHAVLWRKGSHGIQSENGACFVERILTVLGTATKQGVSALAYLRDALIAQFEGRQAPSLFSA